MQSNRGWLWKLLAAVGLVAYQYLVHRVTSGDSGGAVRTALLLVPLLALGWWVATRPEKKWLWWSVLALACGAIFLLESRSHLGLAASYGVPHAVTYLLLLWAFARTLFPGRAPLITKLARVVHGTLAPEIERYTRRVTLAWSVFFAAQVVCSGLLFEFASLEAFSLFVNMLSLPLVVLMFAGEYAYRVTRYPGIPRATLAQTISALRTSPDFFSGAGADARH
jgi:uncharacterized membrane protein